MSETIVDVASQRTPEKIDTSFVPALGNLGVSAALRAERQIDEKDTLEGIVLHFGHLAQSWKRHQNQQGPNLFKREVLELRFNEELISIEKFMQHLNSRDRQMRLVFSEPNPKPGERTEVSIPLTRVLRADMTEEGSQPMIGAGAEDMLFPAFKLMEAIGEGAGLEIVQLQRYTAAELAANAELDDLERQRLVGEFKRTETGSLVTSKVMDAAYTEDMIMGHISKIVRI